MPPRGPNQKSKNTGLTDNHDDDDEDKDESGLPPAPAEGHPQTPIPTFKLWLEEHWHGWLKPVGGIGAVIGAYFLYTAHIIPETFAGIIVLLAIVGGAVVPTTWEALPRLTQPNLRNALIGFAAFWALVAAVPPIRAAFPGKTIAETRIAGTKDAPPTKITIEGDKGPYEIEVSGSLVGTSDAEATYTLTLTGDDGSTQELEGSIKRTWARERTSRRSSATEAVKMESNEDHHRASTVHGPNLAITAYLGGDPLVDGLTVSFHSAFLPPWIFWLLSFVLMIAGFVLDYQFVEPKRPRTYFSTATAFTLVFGAYFPFYATRHSLVRPAIGGLVAGLIAVLVTLALSAMINSFHPKPKKMVGVKA